MIQQEKHKQENLNKVREKKDILTKHWAAIYLVFLKLLTDLEREQLLGGEEQAYYKGKNNLLNLSELKAWFAVYLSFPKLAIMPNLRGFQRT